MAYVKTTWQNSPSTNTPINATNLNHIEQGIYDAAATADQAESGVEALDPRMDLVEQRLDNLIPEGTPTQGNAELIDIRVGANGITYPDAGSAVRGQVTEINSALSDKIDKDETISLNLLSSQKGIDNKFVQNNSPYQLETYSGGILSGFVPVEEGETYTINFNVDTLYIKSIFFVKNVKENSRTYTAVCASTYNGLQYGSWPVVTGLVTLYDTVNTKKKVKIEEGSNITHIFFYISKTNDTSNYYGSHTTEEFETAIFNTQVRKSSSYEQFVPYMNAEEWLHKSYSDVNDALYGSDNTKYSTLGNSIRGQFSKSIAKDQIVSKNEFDVTKAVDNKYFDFGAVFYGSNTQAILVDKFPVEEGKTYTIYNGIYDDTILQIPYIFFINASNNSRARVCAGGSTNWTKYGTDSVHWPLIDSSLVVLNRIGSAIQFTIQEGSNINQVAWYVSKAVNNSYYGTHDSQDFASIVSGIQAYEGTGFYPSGVRTSAIDALTTLWMDKTIAINNNSNRLFGKILCTVGDSITEGTDIELDNNGFTTNPPIDTYTWNSSTQDFVKRNTNIRQTYGYQIAERNHMTFYNGGVGGSTMQGLVDKEGFSLPDGRYTKLPENIDYLTIWFGWNDTAYGTLGTIDDNTNESFYGGYNVVMPYLIDKYPNTKIALIVPYGTDASHREAVRLLANKWGVACWDNLQGGTPLYYNKESSVGVDQSIVTANRAKYQANGAHPNYLGHKQLADMIENFLRSI